MKVWLPWLLVLVGFATALFFYQRGQMQMAASAEAGRVAEAKWLVEKGVLVAARGNAEESAAALLKDNAGLAKQLADLKALTPRVKVIRVVEIKTVVQPALAPVELGDSLFAKVSELGVRTELGNESVVGTVSVFKSPATLVFTSKFDERASRLTIEAPVEDKRWSWWQWALIGVATGTAATLAIRR